MDTQRIKNLLSILKRIGSQCNWNVMPVLASDITSFKNEISIISMDISDRYEHFGKELFRLKDILFFDNGCFNPPVWGQIVAILKSLEYDIDHPQTDIWNTIHPLIIKSSKGLFLDGHFANSAEDAFIEVNDRVKKLFSIVKPGCKTPDGDTVMTTTFSVNSPLIRFCDDSTDTGRNIQKGFMEMLAGAMSALRNPKAHSNNIIISKDECMRRLMFASMLMYKIDEAIKYSGIKET